MCSSLSQSCRCTSICMHAGCVCMHANHACTGLHVQVYQLEEANEAGETQQMNAYTLHMYIRRFRVHNSNKCHIHWYINADIYIISIMVASFAKVAGAPCILASSSQRNVAWLQLALRRTREMPKSLHTLTLNTNWLEAKRTDKNGCLLTNAW